MLFCTVNCTGNDANTVDVIVWNLLNFNSQFRSPAKHETHSESEQETTGANAMESEIERVCVCVCDRAREWELSENENL